jgi:hypothetical protein
MEGDWWIEGGGLVRVTISFFSSRLSLAWLGLCFALCCFLDWIGVYTLGVRVFGVYIYFVNL